MLSLGLEYNLTVCIDWRVTTYGMAEKTGNNL